MSFTLPSLLPRESRTPRSTLDTTTGCASKGPYGRGTSATCTGAVGTLPALAAQRRSIADEGDINAPKALALRLEQLEHLEALSFQQRMLLRCACVESACRQTLQEAFEASCRTICDAHHSLQRAAIRALRGAEGSNRNALEADSWRVRVHLHQVFIVLVEEQHHRSAILSEAVCDVTVLRLHERSFTAAVVGQPFAQPIPRPSSTSVPQTDIDWSMPRDSVYDDACRSMAGIVPVDLLHRLTITDGSFSQLLAHRDASTKETIQAQQQLDRIKATVYTRERAHLDVDAPPSSSSYGSRVPYSLPGLVMPWSFVLEERQGRQQIADEASMAFLELETGHEVTEKCIHTEQRARHALLQLHMWVDEWRMERVLLVQRWWRYLSLESASRRRRRAIRRELSSIATAKRRAEEATVDAIADRIEGIEDATLRDVWAEDYATGAIGLFFPYRKQVLDIGLDKCRRLLYAQFVSSLASQVSHFIRSAHVEAARGMRMLFFSDEVSGRSTIMDDEERVWRAAMHMKRQLEGLWMDTVLPISLLCNDQSRAPPLSLLPSTPTALSERLRAACRELYQDHRRSEQRRVQHCRLGWQQFRISDHKLVFDHRDADAYTAAVSTRIGSAEGVRRLSKPSSERIPSAGYQRPGSSGYRRLSSAGYDRLGSAGYNRLGSAERVRSATRRGSSGGAPQRLRSGGVRAAAPPPKREQRQFPRFWEGYQCVREAKQRIVDAETAARKQALDDAFNRHVHYAQLFLDVLQQQPAELHVASIGSLAHSLVIVRRQEEHARVLEIEDEQSTRCHLTAMLSAHKTAAELCQTTSLGHLANVEERRARSDVEQEEARQWLAMAALMDRLASILAAATEHLRRTGMIPRPASRVPGTVPARSGSALQRDDLAHRRKNYASAARVAIVIQRWWRLKHYKPYRVAEAGLDIVRLIRQRGIQEARQLASASVLQRQLSEVNGDQQLHRRLSSASSAHQRPTQSSVAQRPHSALSNLQNATSESMRTVLSRRLLHHNLFASWASAEAEESSSRAEWVLIENISRCRLRDYYVEVVLASAVAPKLHRIANRLEPTDRLRVEREALSSFVSLFFCPAAEKIRRMFVVDAEAMGRRNVTAEADGVWRRLAATSQAFAETHAALRDGVCASGDVEPSTPAHRLAHCIHQHGTKALQRSRLVLMLPMQRTRHTSDSCVVREEVNRMAVLHAEAHALQAAFALHLQGVRSTLAAELMSLWESQCYDRCADIDQSAARCAFIEYPTGAFLFLGMRQREGRAAVASDEVAAMGELLAEMHAGWCNVHWGMELKRWRHTHASRSYDTTRLVTEALDRRVGALGSKLDDVVALEANGRRTLLAMESMRRGSDGLEDSVRSAVWWMLRRAAH